MVLARRKFYWAKCAPGGNIEEPIQMMQVYQEELNTLRQKILDADFVMTLLNCLPELWNLFIALRSRIKPSPPTSSLAFYRKIVVRPKESGWAT